MKKPYQIESQRAVKQLAEMAAEGNPAVQMVLPLAEMIEHCRSRGPLLGFWTSGKLPAPPVLPRAR